MTEHVPPHRSLTVTGEIVKRPATPLLRVLATVSGFLLIKGVLFLIGRYLLALRAKGTLSCEGGLLTLTAEWSLFGRAFRRSVTSSPLRDVAAVRFENRQRYLYLLVGFGCLAVGTLVGAQWFLDGLKAGYPHLMLVGALVVLSGIVVDLVLYFLFPAKGGRSYLIVTMGPWMTRLGGVDAKAAERLIEAIHRDWQL